jgi:hypothetical protein
MTPTNSFIVTITVAIGPRRQNFYKNFETLDSACSYAETSRHMQGTCRVVIDYRLYEWSTQVEGGPANEN